MRSEPGAGISELWIASLAPSSKRREIRVLKALTRKPIMRKLMTRKMMVPRRIVVIRASSDEERGLEVGGGRAERAQVGEFRSASKGGGVYTM